PSVLAPLRPTPPPPPRGPPPFRVPAPLLLVPPPLAPPPAAGGRGIDGAGRRAAGSGRRLRAVRPPASDCLLLGPDVVRRPVAPSRGHPARSLVAPTLRVRRGAAPGAAPRALAGPDGHRVPGRARRHRGRLHLRLEPARGGAARGVRPAPARVPRPDRGRGRPRPAAGGGGRSLGVRRVARRRLLEQAREDQSGVRRRVVPD